MPQRKYEFAGSPLICPPFKAKNWPGPTIRSHIELSHVLGLARGVSTTLFQNIFAGWLRLATATCHDPGNEFNVARAAAFPTP